MFLSTLPEVILSILELLMNPLPSFVVFMEASLMSTVSFRLESALLTDNWKFGRVKIYLVHKLAYKRNVVFNFF